MPGLAGPDQMGLPGATPPQPQIQGPTPSQDNLAGLLANLQGTLA
jgi:hypothetical protein